jgi:transposase
MGMIPYSNDLREKIILFFENHPDYTQQEVADEFGVSHSFIEKLLQRQRTTNSSAALPRGGGQKSKLRDHEEKIREFVAAQPDITLDELRAQLKSATGLEASRAALCRELQRLNLPRKKRLINQVSKNVRM